jgi:hypothetical protein
MSFIEELKKKINYNQKIFINWQKILIKIE